MYIRFLTDCLLEKWSFPIKCLLKSDLFLEFPSQQALGYFAVFYQFKDCYLLLFFFFWVDTYALGLQLNCKSLLWLVLILYTLQTPQSYTCQRSGAGSVIYETQRHIKHILQAARFSSQKSVRTFHFRKVPFAVGFFKKSFCSEKLNTGFFDMLASLKECAAGECLLFL